MKQSAHHSQVHQDPNFGYDPWLNPELEPSDDLRPEDVASDEHGLISPVDLSAVTGEGLPPIAGGGGPFAGADTIKGDIGLLPRGLAMYASYVDNFGGYDELVGRFGAHAAAFLLSITIFGNPAVCADVQPGAMHASDFPGWYDHKALHDHGPPWGYTSISNMPALVSAAAGRLFVRFSAHYGVGPHVCGPRTCGHTQADWTQWDDKGPSGQNFDRSLGLLLPAPAPPPERRGKGRARALLEVDLATLEHKVTALPAEGKIDWGHMPETYAAVKVELGLGGKVTGHWRFRSEPFDPGPLNA